MNSTEQPSASAWSIWRPYMMDLGAPFIGHFIVQAFGMGAMWALTIAGTLAAVSAAVNTIRRKGPTIRARHTRRSAGISI
jgi:hypothetical protein